METDVVEVDIAALQLLPEEESEVEYFPCIPTCSSYSNTY